MVSVAKMAVNSPIFSKHIALLQKVEIGFSSRHQCIKKLSAKGYQKMRYEKEERYVSDCETNKKKDNG